MQADGNIFCMHASACGNQHAALLPDPMLLLDLIGTSQWEVEDDLPTIDALT